MQKPFLNANKARILLVNSNANLSTEADPCVFSSIIDFDLELFISSWVWASKREPQNVQNERADFVLINLDR